MLRQSDNRRRVPKLLALVINQAIHEKDEPPVCDQTQSSSMESP
jgi:hypothetical protein